MRYLLVSVIAGIGLTLAALAPADAPNPTLPASQPSGLPYVHINLSAKQVRVDCEALSTEMPLEFFCVMKGGNEYESVLRTPAKPSDIHFALLALGLKPGEPQRYEQATKEYFPPTGPLLDISCEFESNGKLTTVPVNRFMRSPKDKHEMPPTSFVFDGSRVLPDKVYAADITGYVVSVVNFDMTMIDVPDLVSNSNETLEWVVNSDVCPPKGTKVTMIITPAKQAATHPSIGKPGSKFDPGPGAHAGP